MYDKLTRALDAQFSEQIKSVELLGELGLSAESCNELGQIIGERIRHWGPAEATRILIERYPCSLAVYLVAQGIYGYHGGLLERDRACHWSTKCQFWLAVGSVL